MDKSSTIAETDGVYAKDKIIILHHNNIPVPINLITLLYIFSIFFILVIVFLLFINPQELNKIQQLTNSLSEYIKSDVLYSDLSDNFLIYLSLFYN